MHILIVNVKKVLFSLCFLLFFAYIAWHMSGFLSEMIHFNMVSISNTSLTWSGFLNFKTIFLSIIIEAIPFILIGVFVSALLQNFVSEEQIKRFLPGSKYSKILLACLMGMIFPVCECGIVPVARRLVSKGVPLYSAVTFMLAAPIINPVVASSTAVAFSANLKMVCCRLGLAFVVAFTTGLLVSHFFDSGELRGTMPYSSCDCGCSHSHKNLSHNLSGRLVNTLSNACDEFFEMGKYLIWGACLAAFVQTTLSRYVLLDIGQGLWSSIAAMMAFAFGISVCSSADAFIAASFSSHFTAGSMLAFMVFGPMIDVKNFLLMLKVFKLRFVVLLTVIVGLLVIYGAYIVNTVTAGVDPF
ncbi:putative two-component membrane permease complex subunit [Pelotomaculum propionicicum]|uniref:Putative two-component membrane permease complex subunit n=2 Tax=Pelotomaculum propionicicum TaxID=258475 RepID=A0A4Y7RJ45_9FIRM|nr:putative two-component membrane permease complex subunit [Pelotomaculum propionicicum]